MTVASYFWNTLAKFVPNMNRVSLFRFKKKMRKEAKQREKDAKQNSKLPRLSETKRNKMRITQFRLNEPLKTILNQKETSEK
jgi:hypothetical protein